MIIDKQRKNEAENLLRGQNYIKESPDMMAQAINLSTGVDFYEFETIPF